jgi:hypothetical protein
MLIWFTAVCLVIILGAYTYMSVATRTYYAEVLFICAITLSPVGVLPLAILLNVSGVLGFVSTVPLFGEYLVEVYSMWAESKVPLLVIPWSFLSLILWRYALEAIWKHKRVT